MIGSRQDRRDPSPRPHCRSRGRQRVPGRYRKRHRRHRQAALLWSTFPRIGEACLPPGGCGHIWRTPLRSGPSPDRRHKMYICPFCRGNQNFRPAEIEELRRGRHRNSTHNRCKDLWNGEQRLPRTGKSSRPGKPPYTVRPSSAYRRPKSIVHLVYHRILSPRDAD